MAVLQGGVIRKLAEWKQPGKPFLLSVEDAQQPGKDIGQGSFKIQLVQQLFAAAATTLQHCLAKRAQHAGFMDEGQREAAAWAVIQVTHYQLQLMQQPCCSSVLPSMHSTPALIIACSRSLL